MHLKQSTLVSGSIAGLFLLIAGFNEAAGSDKVDWAEKPGASAEGAGAPLSQPLVGIVPDGDVTPGPQLLVAKGIGQALELSWGGSCRSTDTDYSVYQGVLGRFDSHVPLACATSGATTVSLVPHGHVYWVQKTGKIWRSNLDGTSAEDVVTGLNQPLLATVAGTKVYWTDQGAGKIQRANLDGTSVETLAMGLDTPRGVAVDLTGAKLYWSVAGKIQRAELNGSNPQDLVPGLGTPLDIELDVTGGRIYWTDSGQDRIQRANLNDGSGVVTVVGAPDADGPFGLDLDLGAGKLYWADQGGGIRSIKRANLNGASVETLVPLTDPQGIALDAAGGKVYWTDQGTGKIQRASLAGAGIEDLASAVSDLAGIAIGGSESAYFLVTSVNGTVEGSYGVDSADMERPASLVACLPSAVSTCP